MKYKEFKKWCTNRACDGCWGLDEAKTCLYIIKMLDSMFFLKREKEWRYYHEDYVVKNIVNPINKKIKKRKQTET